MKKCFYLLLLFSYFQIHAQTSYGVGNWKFHFAMNEVYEIVDGGNNIYCMGPSNLFYYSKEERITTEINKIDGLTGTNITAIAYYPPDDALIIGYQDGNVDLYSVSTKETLNMNAIYRADVSGSKQINYLEVYGEFIYISTNFGVVVYNHGKEEIKESYRNIGPNGEELQIQKSYIQASNDSIFLISEIGIHGASLKSNNLLFFENWEYFPETKPLVINDLLSVKGKTMIATDSSGIYTLGNNGFQEDLAFDTTYSRAKTINDQLIRYRNNSIKVITQVDTIDYDFQNFTINDVEIIDNQIWLGANGPGLVQYNSEDDFKSFYPPGPPSNSSANFGNLPGEFYILPGSERMNKDRLFVPGVYKQNGVYWEMAHPEFYSVGEMAYNEITDEECYASNSFGLQIITPDGKTTSFDSENPIVNKQGIEQPSPIPSLYPRTRVASVDIDQYGNTWFITYGGTNNDQLFVLDRDWNINSFAINHPWMINAWNIEADPAANYIWIYTFFGLIVYDYENDRFKTITSESSGGFLYGNVNCMEFDQNGDLWLGTEKGVTVLYDTYRVFDDINYDDSPPVYENQPLLYNEYINSIYIDGGNRKWFGTPNGAWLVDASGTEQILHFDKDNSPLPSNNVNAIGINETDGEVFFSMTEGVVSYWGDATEATEVHSSDVKVFPNPVKPEFSGQIAITGLASNSIVKITDISGNLVYETQANGGMAIWNGKRQNGKKPDTGVYLVYSAEPAGNDGYVAKIVFIQ